MKFKVGDIILFEGKEQLIKGIGRSIHGTLNYGLINPNNTDIFIKSRYKNIFTGFNENASCTDVDKEATFIETIFDRDAYCNIKEALKKSNEESEEINKRILSLEGQLSAIEKINCISNFSIVITPEKKDG